MEEFDTKDAHSSPNLRPSWVLVGRTPVRWVSRCCVGGRLHIPRLTRTLLTGRDWAMVWVAAQQVR